MSAHEHEQASFEAHQAWLTGCGSDADALDAAAESMTGEANVEEALDRARDLADQFESQAAQWRGIVRALEQVPSNPERATAQRGRASTK